MQNKRMIEIVSLTPQDAGHFKCVATNKLGRMDINIDVTVGAPARIDRTKVLTRYTVKEGDELLLPCPSNGAPPPRLMFSRNRAQYSPKLEDRVEGTPIPPTGFLSNSPSLTRRAMVSQERQALTIFRTEKADAGVYQCNSSNAVGWDIHEYIVQVHTPPTIDLSNVQPEEYWFVNQTRSLYCTLMGNSDPPAKIRWERHGSPVVSGGDVEISEEGSKLTVFSVKNRDAGDYVCKASNEVGETSQSFRVQVFVRPQFVDRKRKVNINAIQNQTISLMCEVKGDPTPKITWFRKDIEIISDRREESYQRPNYGSQGASIGGELYNPRMSVDHGDQIIRFSNIQPEDAGEYTCAASNGGGTIERKFIVTVIMPPKIIKTGLAPEEIQTMELVPVTLTCLIYEADKVEAEITWTKDGQPIYLSENGDYYVSQMNGQKLNVLRPSAEESGTYKSPPRFPREFNRYLERFKVNVLSEMKLECPAFGMPKPTITWYHNGAPISSYSRPSTRFMFQEDKQVLVLTVNQDDAGQYRCVARNMAGNITKDYELDISMPPLVWLDKTEVREREGATFTILCKVEGVPTPTLEWSRANGGLFRVGTSVDPLTGILTITGAKTEDSGEYVCTAKNRIGHDSKSVEIKIVERPKITSIARPIVVNEGDQVLLPCEATGSQPIEIQWRKPTGQEIPLDVHDGPMYVVHVRPKISKPAEMTIFEREGAPLQLVCNLEAGTPAPEIHWERNGIVFSRTRSTYTTTDSGLFIINNLRAADEGELTCIARNSAGEDRVTFRIEVQVPPKVLVSSSIIGYEDQDVTMQCNVSGKPPPKVTWEYRRQDPLVTLGSRARMEGSNTIRIFQLKPEDAGSYICVATSPDGTAVPPPVREANDGQFIQLNCRADGRPKPNIEWTFEGVPIPSDSNKYGMSAKTFRPLRPKDAGNYACIASNEVGKKQYQFQLVVKTRPFVNLIASDEAPTESQTARLSCDIKSGDVESIIWLKDGVPLSNSSRISIVNNGQNLVISNTKSKDTGVYQCIATNAVGEGIGELVFQVSSAPRILEQPEDHNARIGSLVILRCTVEGQPAPQIVWYRNDRPVHVDALHSFVGNGSFRIIAANLHDEGQYHCIAKSRLGEVRSRNAQLLIQVDGGFSTWGDWSECSQTCGRGFQSRERKCDSPEPRNGGQYCVGETSETKECLVRICPQDGQWGSWTPWSRCSTTCGAGLRQRTKRCDSPPPSNGGKSCEGEAFEEILCEGLPPCALDGSWSEWTEWSQCSRSCGRGGTQKRIRYCNNPAPLDGGRPCAGRSEMVRICNKQDCPTDGQWGSWTPWSLCSKSCGGGIKRRTRKCDNPAPTEGGADCPANEANTQDEQCNTELCPINGEWSNWSSWSACSKSCGAGLKSRTRTCTEPSPSNGGRMCSGADRQVEKCIERQASAGEICPDLIDNGSGFSWSSWKAWSPHCQKDCSRPGTGFRVRTRTCLNPLGQEVAHGCVGDSAEESESCNGPFDPSNKCPNEGSAQTPRWGKIIGQLRGVLGGKDLGNVLYNGTWNYDPSLGQETVFSIDLLNVRPEFRSCLQILTGLFTPAVWHSSTELNEASNGHTVNGPAQIYTWDMESQFSDGSLVRMDHQVRHGAEHARESGLVTMDTKISGSCPKSVSMAHQLNRQVDLLDATENFIQMSPAKGSMFSESSRAFKVHNFDDGSMSLEPYTWYSRILAGPGNRQRYVSQEMSLRHLSMSPVSDDTLRFTTSSTIDRGQTPDDCPSGFEVRRTHLDATRNISPWLSDYCIGKHSSQFNLEKRGTFLGKIFKGVEGGTLL
ncbi:hypothetical protein Ciccas_005642 [Cichlidogyrus casuarinus]|uniref:Ig-like domain-containing protein n=1 Tax=Cichlidogyrus casuarinus TaxID=1844966 RepID=A0ABD2Q844_9PLAT